ncbi:MAG: hypothetical protein OEZ06_31935 [Myxococcales bacterium]|nr:hypothetical protein [Myxococcales bacterium]
MALAFDSQAWGEALSAALAEDPDFAEAARGWTHGPLALLQADASQPALLLTLGAEGGALETAARDEVQRRAALVLVASSDTWDGLLAGRQTAAHALMNGALKLVQGRLAAIIGEVLLLQRLFERAGAR